MSEKKKIQRGYLNLLVRIGIFILILWLMFSQVLFLKRMEGNSMFPMLKDGDLSLGFRLQRSYEPGDVVWYRADGSDHFGRVIASAGSEVDIDGSGEVKINGIAESGEILFPSDDAGNLNYPYTVPENSVFILCDNRTVTEDSRTYGAVNIKEIKGKALSILRRRGL